MAENRNKNRKNLTAKENLSLCLERMNLNSTNSGSSSKTKTAYTLALENGKLVLSVETESSKQQHTSHRPKSSPQTSKPHSKPNTAQKNPPHASKTHPNLSNEQKNTPSTSKTHTNSNNAQKKFPNTFKTGQNSSPHHSNSKPKPNPPKANPNFSTGQKNPPVKTHSNLIQKKSFKNTFNPHPKFNTGSKNYLHAFRNPSDWPIGYEISSAAPNVHPTLNDFALNNSPVYSHGFRDHSPRPQYESDRYQMKEHESQKPEQRNYHNTNENGLNCPTCNAPYLSQIYQCASGHSACSNCKEKGWPCAVCGQAITDMRNFTLEGFLAEKKVPCPHEGCKLFIKRLEVNAHIKECPFGILECPAGCSYKMSLKQLSGHFDDHHPGQRLVGVGTEVDLRDIYEPSQKMYLIQVGAFHFLFHEWVSAQDRQIYMAAQLIGTKVSASKWYYEIQIYAKNEPHRLYTFSEICTSFVEPVAGVFNESKCCILTQTRAVTFLNNAVVNYKVFIKKIVETKPQTELCD